MKHTSCSLQITHLRFSRYCIQTANARSVKNGSNDRESHCSTNKQKNAKLTFICSEFCRYVVSKTGYFSMPQYNTQQNKNMKTKKKKKKKASWSNHTKNPTPFLSPTERKRHVKKCMCGILLFQQNIASQLVFEMC